MSLAADGHRARMADYADRTRDRYEDQSDDELRSKLMLAGVIRSSADALIDLRDDPAGAAAIERQLAAAE